MTCQTLHFVGSTVLVLAFMAAPAAAQDAPAQPASATPAPAVTAPSAAPPTVEGEGSGTTAPSAPAQPADARPAAEVPTLPAATAPSQRDAAQNATRPTPLSEEDDAAVFGPGHRQPTAPSTATTPHREMGTGAPGTDSGNAEGEEERDVSQDRFLHGFRLGYLFMMNVDAPYDPTDADSETYRQHYHLRSPHQFVVGYEITWRMIGFRWLNVLLVGNVLIAGLEQSRFFPAINGLLGFEFKRTFQLGVGVSLTPTKDRPAHMLIAAGWTPRVGGFYIPVHFFFVPDVYGHHRIGVTTGVNW